MGFISEEQIAEVRERADIAAIIGRKVQLKRSGRVLKGLCPFHNERTPSFQVSPERGFYHCFGCQASGDVFKFIIETEHQNFAQVVRDLAREVGVEIKEKEEAPDEKKARERREWLYRVNDYVNEFFVHTYWNEREAERARAYMRGRQISEETQRTFAIGYAPRRADSLLAYLKHKNVPLEAAVEAGVLGKRDDGSHYLRLFDRVTFTIYDERDRIAGFGGRLLDPEAKAAKYINSPETPLFRKSRLLYGFSKAKSAVARKGAVWLCEGYLDVIALHQAGLEQAVAPLGTALTPEHVPLLRRVTTKAMTMFDGDAAGLRATRRSAELLLAHGFAVQVMALPPGDDPDTLVLREGPDFVRAASEKAPPAVQFFIDQAAQAMAPSVEGRVAAAQDMAPLIGKISSQLERDLYVREAARKFGIDEDVLRRHFNRRSPSEPRVTATAAAPPPAAVARATAVTPPPKTEWLAVLELLKYRVTWEALPQAEALVEHEGLRRIVRQCIENDAELTFEMMREWLGHESLAQSLAAALCEDLSAMLEDGQREGLIADVILDLEHQAKRRELQALNLTLERAEREGTLPLDLLRKKRELNLWLKRERPRRREQPPAPKP